MTNSEGAARHHYWAFGLRISSRLEIPEFIESIGPSDPDVRIELGPVAEPSDAQGGLALIGGALVLVVPDVGRYCIADGSLITIDSEPGVPQRNVRLYLLGSAFGALLHQRGLLPLHANAVEIEGGAVAFMGASGEGKSTLAAWFHDQGYRVLTDDVCVVKLSPDGQALVAPGSQRLRLWKEALEASGRDPSQHRRSFEGRPDIQKFDVPFEEQRGSVSERPLTAIYLLESAETFSIERIQGAGAAEAVFSHTYRGGFVNTAGLQQEHWESAIQLMQRVPIFRINRPRDLGLLGEHGGLIREHVAGAAHS
jgi:hypothetical protein